MRLFVGLSLSDDITTILSSLRGSLPFINWYPPETYHITLCFIGEINDHYLINDLDLALQRINFPRFTLTIETVNYFIDSNQNKTLWAGIHPSANLTLLQKKISQTIKSLDLPYSKRKFVPHIALGKSQNLSNNQLEKWLHHYNLLKLTPMEILQFSLFSSASNKDEPYYINESDYFLN